MKNLLIIFLLSPALLLAQKNGAKQKRVLSPDKKIKQPIPAAGKLSPNKTMTLNDLAALGIELPGTFFHVSATIAGLKDSTRIVLTNTTDGKVFAETKSANGQFNLHGKLPYEGLYAINLEGYPYRPTVFMTNDSVKLSGHISNMEQLAIAGGQSTQDFEIYRKQFDEDATKLTELQQRINAGASGFERDSLINAYKQIVLVKADTFMQSHPASLVSPFVLFTMAGLVHDIDELSNRYHQFAPEAKGSHYAQLINRIILDQRNNKIGDPAQGFTQTNLDGKPVSLKQFKGKNVILHFWSSWCTQCEPDLMPLKDLYNRYKAKGLVIIGVSVDTDRRQWQKAVKQNTLPWVQLSDLRGWGNEVAVLYKVETMPQNFLIDKEGRISAKNMSMMELADKLKELYNE
jgi:peroxiredoxin